MNIKGICPRCVFYSGARILQPVQPVRNMQYYYCISCIAHIYDLQTGGMDLFTLRKLERGWKNAEQRSKRGNYTK